MADTLLAERDFLDEACRWEEGEFPVFGFSAYTYRGFVGGVWLTDRATISPRHKVLQVIYYAKLGILS